MEMSSSRNPSILREEGGGLASGIMVFLIVLRCEMHVKGSSLKGTVVIRIRSVFRLSVCWRGSYMYGEYF